MTKTIRYMDVCDQCGDPCENIDSYSDCCNEPVVTEAVVIIDRNPIPCREHFTVNCSSC